MNNYLTPGNPGVFYACYNKSMYLIDSHCHLHDREFFSEEQATNMLKNAAKRNVKQIVCIGTSHEDSLNASAFASSYQNVYWTYGIHPESANNYTINCKKDNKLVAIGEIGLDYHYEGYDRRAQIKLLEQALQLAIDLNLPCSFHVRDALPDFFAVVKNFSELKPSVLHSFSDTKESLEYALSQGFYIGVNGLITFANLACYKNLTPDFLDHCILETDAPFLTPEPNRGKINEPGNIADIAAWLSRKLGVSEGTIAEKTTDNARKIFHIPNPESAEPGARAEFS